MLLLAAVAALGASVGTLSDRAYAADGFMPLRPEPSSPQEARIAASRAWGEYANGRIPPEAMSFAGVSYLGYGDQYLRSDALVSYQALNNAFQEAFGKPLVIGEAYRSYERQEVAYAKYLAGGPEAAVPGTSIHGWALAIDFGSRVDSYGTPEKAWMNSTGPAFGWQPRGDTFRKPEAWHFEYDESYVPVPQPEPEPTPIPEEILTDMKLITRNGSYWLIGEFTSQLIDATFLAELKSRFGVSANLGTLVAALKKQYGEPIEFTGGDSVEVLTRVANYNRLELIARIQGK